MGKKGKKAQAGKPKKLTPKGVGKRLDVLAKNLEKELKGADLFAPLPLTEDCVVCFVPLPYVKTGTHFYTCCGNTICVACVNENKESIKKQNEEKNSGKKLALTCPFCRETKPADVPESLRRLQARCLKNDHRALTSMGDVYHNGQFGTAKDDLKALDCYIQAVELGSDLGCIKIGLSYRKGNGVSVNKERATLFDRIGALRGDIVARHNIGNLEFKSDNLEVAIRHWKIAAEAGMQASIDMLKKIYNVNVKIPGKQVISKECMNSLYRVCHDAQEEVKSEEREKHCRQLDEFKC